jgi:phosphoribosylaminoimidazole-succinocarboxamide synthase
MLSATVIDPIVNAVPALGPHRDELARTRMLSRRTDVFPVECVMRGYLSGSAWKEYLAAGTLAGERLPAGLRESSRLDPSIFSPATKAESGHDENITIGRWPPSLGTRGSRDSSASRGRCTTSPSHRRAARHHHRRHQVRVRARGRKTILLIDEVITPDSSRFWPADQYAPGRPQPSFDKQPLRDWLDGERKAGRWNGDSPPPDLPERSSLRRVPATSRLSSASPAPPST